MSSRPATTSTTRPAGQTRPSLGSPGHFGKGDHDERSSTALDRARPGLVENPQRLAEFWGPALGYLNLGAFGSYVALFPDGRPGPKLLLQQVAEPKAVKNRMHLDIEAPDIEVEVARLPSRSAPVGCRTLPAVNTGPPGCCWPTRRATSSACVRPANLLTDLPLDQAGLWSR